jgi:hypothetical protein
LFSCPFSPLNSAYEQKHDNSLSDHDDLQNHPFSYKWHNFFLLYGWIKFSCIYISDFLSPFIHW